MQLNIAVEDPVQPEALGLYLSVGYREISAFGRYRPDPVSVFVEKRLGGRRSGD